MALFVLQSNLCSFQPLASVEFHGRAACLSQPAVSKRPGVFFISAVHASTELSVSVHSSEYAKQIKCILRVVDLFLACKLINISFS